jgi:iron complex transport system substrate-binding protein
MRLRLALLSFLLVCSPARADGPRIISITPSTTEIACAIGLENNLVGVSTFCDYPPEVKEKERVGSFSDPNIEKIMLLKPDIVLATGLEQAQAVRNMRKLGIKVIVVDPAGFDGLFKSIEEIGIACGKKTEALDLVKEMKGSIGSMKKDAGPAVPGIYFEIWHDPLMTAGKGSFIDEMITLAGGRNIAWDTPRPYSRFSAELIIERDPDVIILGYMVRGESAVDSVRKRAGWSGIKAVKESRVYDDIDPDILFRPGPRLIKGIEELNKRFYGR